MTTDAKQRKPLQGRTTAIGSLPHHNADAALEFAFQFDIPFLPQIPIRNPSEFMLPQALDGLPGLEASKEGDDGIVRIQLDRWNAKTKEFQKLLDSALNSPMGGSLERFLPSGGASSSWTGFLWELHERKLTEAKVQIAGPLTTQWTLKSAEPELNSQIFRLILARALAMVTQLKNRGITPLIFLDEPGLYAYRKTEPAHVLAAQELRILIRTLQKSGAWVGVHCCSQTDWETLLSLKPDYVSLDARLSLHSLLAASAALGPFLTEGGKLSLGMIPSPTGTETETDTSKNDPLYLKTPVEAAAEILETTRSEWKALGGEALLSWEKLTSSSLLTPACGLALHSVDQAQWVLETLKATQKLIQRQKEKNS